MGEQKEKTGYKATGTIPDTIDMTAIQARVDERVAAREARDYDLADSIQEELAGQNIRLDDRFKTWRYSDASQPYEARGTIPDTIDTAAIQARVMERVAAREARDYALSDSIRDELLAQNIRIDDRYRTWAYNDDGVPYEAHGTIPDTIDRAAIQARVDARTAARAAKDYGLADSNREELIEQNVHIRDDFRTWEYRGDGELDSAAAAENAKVEKMEDAILEFAKIDVNNDGLISPEEFVTYKSGLDSPAAEGASE